MLPIIGLYLIALTLICVIIFLIFKGKAKNIAKYIIFSIFIGLYIQGNYLNFGYGVLDGYRVRWETMITKGIINTCIWIVIFAIPFIFKKLKKEKLFNLISSCVSLLVIGVQVMTLGFLIASKNQKSTETKNGLNNNNILNLSKDENIIVFMADTFEGTFMNEILEKNPEYKEKLQDFIYFDNCTTTSFFTYSSMPMLLTGEEIKVGNTLKENLKECFDNTNQYNVLKENGYSIQLYTEKVLSSGNSQADNLNGIIDNVSTKYETKSKIGNKMYKYVLYRYLPHFLKSKFVVSSDDFNEIKSNDDALIYKYSSYYLDDVKFNNALEEDGIETGDKKKSFKFYQLSGMHAPYNTTTQIEYNTRGKYQSLPEEERRYNEGLATLNILINYVDGLKKEGIYDKTTIIFMADHGYFNRFYTTLLVKKKDTRQDFTINSAPVSLLEDLSPTIMNLASNSKNYGKDFFDYKEGEERTRKALDYTYSTHIISENSYKPISKITFETKGLASDKSSFYIASEEYENENKELTKKYKFGEIIKTKDILTSNSVNLTGFVLEDIADDIETGWNISKKNYLSLIPEKTNKDVTATFEISKILGKDQTINFKINGNTLYSEKLKENSTIKFKIPKNLWNENEKLELEIEFPDAYLGLYHATTMSVAKIESIKFTN